jgi:serine/threonine-protein kinase
MHGYVHRDINPNNVVILESGAPVLIDFGISSRVDTRIITDSGTIGYRPPDGRGMTWTVDTDLYALGLTMAQSLAGMDLRTDGVDDLRKAVKAETAGTVADVILKLCESSCGDRYETATAALRDLSFRSK